MRGDAKELDALFSDVSIRVTSVFRNPQALETLERKMFPKLIAKRGRLAGTGLGCCDSCSKQTAILTINSRSAMFENTPCTIFPTLLVA
jgi:hypothetical protein